MTIIRILGLDPSTVATGRAILDVEGRHEEVIALGVFKPAGDTLDEKMLSAYWWAGELIAEYEPQVLAIETPFFKLNARTMFTLASLGAAMRLAATAAGLRVLEVAPAERCGAVGMPGNAAKQQILHTVNAIYGLELTDHNVSDAVAIAAAGALKLRDEALRA